MTIRDLLKQDKPFLVSYNNDADLCEHEMVIYPITQDWECLDCYPGTMYNIGESLFTGCTVIDWFEESNSSSCTCSISSLMGNGCTCGAIIRYTT